MQEYLWKNAFRERMDTLGFLMGTLVLCWGWFLLLWGIRVQSILAGAALWGMVLVIRRQGRERRLARKEKKLRRMIGGEMRLQELVLLPVQRAAFELALLLSEKEEFLLERICEEGVLCREKGKAFLLCFLPLPVQEKVKARDVLQCRRAARREGAEGVWLCASCAVSQEAEEQMDDAPGVRFFDRQALIHLLGEVYPATDGQLVELGKKRKQKWPAARVMKTVLRPEKARRYAWYGLLLLGMYMLTGMVYYAVPGLVCAALFAASRCMARQ